MQSFIHYLPRRVVLDFPSNVQHPWFRRYQKRGDGFDRPNRHTTRQRAGPASAIEPGDRIWIVSQIFSPWGSLPPGIDARIDVEEVTRRRGGGYNYIAAASSAWFPLIDARPLLQELKTLNAAGREVDLWGDVSRPVGHSLQSIRRLSSSDRLTDWEIGLDARPLNFISYRIADGSAGAFLQALSLVEGGEKVFWDRWCLPRRLAERREVVSSSKLDEKLLGDLRSAAVVWGIETDKYWEPGFYAQKEFNAARALQTYRSVPQQPRFSSGSPALR